MEAEPECLEIQAEQSGQRTRATSTAWKLKVELLARGTEAETGSADWGDDGGSEDNGEARRRRRSQRADRPRWRRGPGGPRCSRGTGVQPRSWTTPAVPMDPRN